MVQVEHVQKNMQNRSKIDDLVTKTKFGDGKG